MFLKIFMSVSVFLLMIAASVQAKTELVVPGTGDSQSLLRILAVEFDKHPDFHVVIPDSIGSGGGVKAVGRDKNEMARVARGIKDKEKKYNLEYRIFARSPVIFAVNGRVGINNLSAAQVVSIFNGSVDNWQKLGGKHEKINVVQREKGDSSRGVLEKKLPGFNEIVNFAGKIVYSTPEVRETLLKTEFSVGYIPLASVRQTDLKFLRYENLNPLDPKDQEAYPLVTPFGIVWKKGKLSEGMAMFKDFLFSPEAAALISEYGAIPVGR